MLRFLLAAIAFVGTLVMIYAVCRAMEKRVKLEPGKDPPMRSPG